MKNATIIASVCLLAACASRPDGIAPANVSALEYKGLSCEETQHKLNDTRAQLVAYEKTQRQAATVDAVGTALLLVPLGTVFGGDKEGRVAQAKGEVNALERALPMNCSSDTE